MGDTLLQLEFTPLEAHDLLLAIERHCICGYDALIGQVVSRCAAHDTLADTPALKRLLFARRLAERWLRAEFSCGISALGDG